jgi:aconitate hydratase
VKAYAKAQGLYRTKTTPDPVFTDVMKLELGSVEPSLAGPKRPQDRVLLKDVKNGFAAAMDKEFNKGQRAGQALPGRGAQARYRPWRRRDRAITSCTNTSNPNVDGGGGLARRRRPAARGLKPKPWVKTSLAPGRRSVANIWKIRLQKELDKIGFNLVGFGCTSCIGNSGRWPRRSPKSINKNDVVAAAVLSGNRNFEGRVNADVRRQLSRLAAAGRRLCTRRQHECRSARSPDRRRTRRQEGLPARTLAEQPRDRGRDPQVDQQGRVREEYADVFKGEANWRKIAVKGG